MANIVNSNTGNLYQDRQAELNVINAIKLPLGCVDALGKVTYHPMIKGESYGGLDSIMKSIIEIYKTPEGFKGTSIYKDKDGDEAPRIFSINIVDGKLNNFGNSRTAKVNYGLKNGRLRINFNYYQISIPFSRLLACINLLMSGYVVDNWNILQVNHKDNSAGSYYSENGWKENIDPDNLELYVENKVNDEHYRIWKMLCKKSIISSFSAYNTRFIAYVNRLKKLGKLTPQTIELWKHTKDQFGVVHFE